MRRIGVQGEFPLRWPEGRPRTPRGKRRRARFKLTLGAIRDDLVDELRRLGAHYATISTNLALRQDGLPYAKQPQPRDPAVAVYFDLRGETYCMACDRYDLVEDNLRAVGLTIEAMRGIERWGSGEMFRQAFVGFTHKQLGAAAVGWRMILGRDIQTQAEARRRFKEMATECHPDHGGTDEAMRRLNGALAEALGELPG
jgi:hypothetical protein